MTFRERHGLDVLRDHALDCEQCATASPPLSEIDRALSADDVTAPQLELSALLAAGAGPILQARVAAAFRRRVLVRLVLAVAPLPILAVGSAFMLQAAHEVLARVLPQLMATYVVGGYAAVLVLLTGATYASIPLVLERRERALVAAA